MFNGSYRGGAQIFQMYHAARYLDGGIISHVLLGLLQMFRYLMTSILIADRRGRIPSRVTDKLRVLGVHGAVFMVLMFIKGGVFSVMDISLSLAVSMFFGIQQVTRRRIRVKDRTYGGIRRVPFKRLVRAGANSSFGKRTRAAGHAGVGRAGYFTVYVTGILRCVRRLMFVHVPINLFRVRGSSNDRIVCRFHHRPCLLLCCIVDIVVFSNNGNRRNLVNRIPIYIVRGLFVSHHRFATMVRRSWVSINGAHRFNGGGVLMIVQLNGPRRNANVVTCPNVRFIPGGLVILVFNATFNVTRAINMLYTGPSKSGLRVLHIRRATHVVKKHILSATSVTLPLLISLGTVLFDGVLGSRNLRRFDAVRTRSTIIRDGRCNIHFIFE